MKLDERFVDKADWPFKDHGPRVRAVSVYNDLFEGDPMAIRAWAQRFREKRYIHNEFVSYPLPEIAARTLATFLFGENAVFTSDQNPDYLLEFIEDNHLHALNQEAAVTCTVDGEIFYKLDWDKDVSDDPIVSVVGGGDAIPVFRFGRLLEIAFVRELDRSMLDAQKVDDGVVVRHVELRIKGQIAHRLFRGTADNLGAEIDLEKHPDTEGMGETVDTDVDDLLVRHVPWWRTSKSPHGISIFRAKEGLIDAVHALYSQDQHDAEMAKKRVAVSKEFLQRDNKGNPKFDRTLDLFELSDSAAGPVGGENKPVHAIEFGDSLTMGERIAQRIDEALLAMGIAPQSAGRDVAGAAESGTARRLAQSLTLQTVASAGRYFSPALKDIIELGIVVAGKQLKRSSAKPIDDLTVALKDGLVDDLPEIATRINTARSAGAMSIEQAVREQHPDWTEEQIEAEVDRIESEEGLKIPGSLNPPGDIPPEPEDDADEIEETDDVAE